MIAFEWPWAFALLALPLLVRTMLPPAPVRQALELPIADELRAVMDAGRQGPGRQAVPALVAWCLLVLAAAQPRWTGAPVPMPVQARDLLLAIDVSGSMREADVDSERRSFSRLQAVQEVAGEFIERREGDRLGVILFGTRAYLYAPLSLDRRTVAHLLGEVDVGLAGDSTAIGDAILAGVKHLRDSPPAGRVLILLTDGENTAGSLPPDQAADLAARAGIRIHTIGFGADAPSNMVLRALDMEPPRVDVESLRRIAQTTGGRFFSANTTGELQQVYAAIDELEPAQVEARTFHPTRSLFHWPLAAAAALASLLLLMRRRAAP